jgi:hypothetical protein
MLVIDPCAHGDSHNANDEDEDAGVPQHHQTFLTWDPHQEATASRR